MTRTVFVSHRCAWPAGVALLGLASLLSGTTGCSRAAEPATGAVIVRCEPGRAGARSGLGPGDVAVGWQRADRRGPISSPFDLALVEQEEAPRGPVTLEVQHGRWRRRLAITAGKWGAEARPVLPPRLLAAWREADGLAGDAADAAGGAARWRALASELTASKRPAAGAWCRLKAAVALAEEGQRDEADDEVRTGAELITDPSRHGIYWEYAGDAFLQAKQKKLAVAAFTAALSLHRKENRNSCEVAFTLLRLCSTDQRSHRAEAEEALAIYRGVQGPGVNSAGALYELANADYFHGQFGAAEKSCREALYIMSREAPDAPLHGDILGRLGLAVLHQGDFEEALRFFQQELEVAERVTPASGRVGHALNDLGLVAKALGENQVARSWYLRGLEVFRGCRPGGVEVAGMLNNLGNVAMRDDDLADALHYHLQALAIRERLHPGGGDVAASLNNLGSIERQLGHSDSARRYLEQALALKRRLAPGSLTLANTLIELGMVAVAQQQLDEAGRLYAEALTIRGRLTPNSPQVAEALYLQGALALTERRLGDAERLWRRAISLVEQRQEGLDLSEDEQSRFGARYYQFYGGLARLLAREGRGEEAFELLERARSRALRAMVLASQAVPSGVPGRLWASYRRCLQQIDRLRAEVARQPPPAGRSTEDGPLVEELHSREGERDRMAAEIRTAAPRLARLRPVTAPTLDQVRAALEPGTVLLSYVVGKDELAFFVVGPAADTGGRLRVHFVPVGSSELKRRIEILLAFIARGRDNAAVDPALITQSRRLFQLLIEPAMERVGAAKRLLIVPDGPLRYAPFAALVLPGKDVCYLGARKPIFFSSSAGALLALRIRKKGRSRPGNGGLVAFGDPVYPRRSAAVRAYGLAPLAGSREEVERIAAGFGRDAHVYLGREATERRARSLTGTGGYLHFAVHACPDIRFPLQSALFLSMTRARDPQADDDGILHAWEVMDAVHCDAEVVTLSGCSTGSGERVEGEGLLGLVRAFQYAGARTVVASRWPVGDRATAALMERFYGGLRGGVPTAEALRRAQNALATAPVQLEDGQVLDARHPFHWAAFQVTGDWH
jgi:CHAT domain-containing protein/tetratricopeptide (TPR) repeat protein